MVSKRKGEADTGLSFRLVMFFLFVAGLLVAASPAKVIAEDPPESGVCCVSYLGCDAYIEGTANPITYAVCSTRQTATIPFKFLSQSCSSITGQNQDCEEGCCCLFNDLGEFAGTSTSSVRYQCSSNYFKSSSNPNCAAVCEDAYVLVSGKVFYANGAPASAEVKFVADNSDEFTYAASTSPDGSYRLVVRESKNYVATAKDISANANPLCITPQLQVSVGTADITNKDFNLPCNPSPGSGCTPEWSYTYSNQQQQCGTILSVNVVEDCGLVPPPTAPYQVGDTIVCLPTGGGCNPNSILNPGEQCDPLPPPKFPPGFNTLCTSVSGQNYVAGLITCTSDCKISYDYCVRCPSSEIGCTEEMCSYCPICQNTQLCQQASECKNSDKVSLVVTQLEDDKWGFKSDWSFAQEACYDEVVSYTLKGCESLDGQQCSAMSGGLRNIAFNMLPATVLYEHILPDTYAGGFCYELTANMKIPLAVKKSDVECLTIDSGVCFGVSQGSVCDGNNLVKCKDGKIKVEQGNPKDCAPGVCVDPSGNNNAFCLETSVCEFCNGVFGMFGYEEYDLSKTNYRKIFLDNFPLATVNSCDDMLTNYQQYGFLGVCYSDDYSEAKSAVGELKACSGIENCYDYKTQLSCETSPCEPVEAQDCEWVSITEGDELGIGICRPSDLDMQECSECDTNSVLGFCSEEICSFFGGTDEEGDKCFFNKNATQEYIIDEERCMNREDVGCETYDSKQECIGKGQGVNFVMNINYFGNGNIKTGNNAIISTSHDFLEKGRCYWDEQSRKCFKDSDNSFKIAGPMKSDCFDEQDKQCLLDMESPNTVLGLDEDAYYSMPQLTNIAYSITDNQYSAENLKTLFFLEKISNIASTVPSSPGPDDNPYPNTTAENLRGLFSGAGKYRLYFFSEDKSKNKERVKDIDFNIIEKLDFGVITRISSGYVVGADIFESNLSVNVSYIPPFPGQWLKCTSTLKFKPNASITFSGSGDGTKLYPDLGWNYFRLQDGPYSLNITCWDGNMQRLQKIVNIDVDADSTIKSPRPRGEKFRPGQIEISIMTEEEATCYYTNDPDYRPPDKPSGPPAMQPEWDAFESDDGLEHTASVAEQNDGMKIYFPYCIFSDGRKDDRDFYGNYADMMYFVIDGTPPNITLIDASTNLPYTPVSYPVERLTLKIMCNDTSVVYQGVDYSFGCDSLLYCEFRRTGNDPVACVPRTKVTTAPWSVAFATPDVGTRKSVVFFVNDSGGNNNTLSAISLSNLRNLTFVPPSVIICDPERGLNCTVQP